VLLSPALVSPAWEGRRPPVLGAWPQPRSVGRAFREGSAGRAALWGWGAVALPGRWAELWRPAAPAARFAPQHPVASPERFPSKRLAASAACFAPKRPGPWTALMQSPVRLVPWQVAAPVARQRPAVMRWRLVCPAAVAMAVVAGCPCQTAPAKHLARTDPRWEPQPPDAARWSDRRPGRWRCWRERHGPAPPVSAAPWPGSGKAGLCRAAAVAAWRSRRLAGRATS
jgi:hypothetical protein